jgi:hypothetical protein
LFFLFVYKQFSVMHLDCFLIIHEYLPHLRRRVNVIGTALYSEVSESVCALTSTTARHHQEGESFRTKSDRFWSNYLVSELPEGLQTTRDGDLMIFITTIGSEVSEKPVMPTHHSLLGRSHESTESSAQSAVTTSTKTTRKERSTIIISHPSASGGAKSRGSVRVSAQRRPSARHASTRSFHTHNADSSGVCAATVCDASTGKER